MQLDELGRDSGHSVDRFDYGDEAVIAVDFGPTEGVAEVVDETVIVVVDDDQYDLELPEDAAAAGAFMKNGVLTVELEGHR